MQQFNGGIVWLLEDKGAPLATAATALASILLTAPVPNSLCRIHALLLTRCREEARNRNLGMLRPGQATDIFPSCAAQGATTGPGKSH